VRSQNPQTFSGFAQGLNVDTQPYQLHDGEARSCSNVVSTIRGAIRKRDGNQTFTTTGASLTSLYPSASPNFLIGAAGTVLYSIGTSGTVTTIKTAMTNGALWSWVNAPISGGQGPLYGTNGTDIQQWDGAAGTTSAWTAATGTLPTGAKYLTYAGNRVWAAGMSSYAGVSDPGSTVVFSNLADPRDWPAVNVVQFDPKDGESISGIGRCGPYVVVFKPSKTWVVYDLDTGANRPLGTNVGCVAHRSIVETSLGCFFLGKDELWLTDGSTVKSVSRGRVSSLVQSILLANRGLAAGAFWNNHYYLAHSTAGSANNQILDYDTTLDSFWLHTPAEAQLAVWEGDGQKRLYGGRGTTVDKLFVPGELQDNGANFTASWASKFFTFDAPQLRKRVWGVHFDGTGRIDASLAKDFATTSALSSSVNFAGQSATWGTDVSTLWESGTGAWGVTALVGDARIKTPGVARAWSVLFGNSTADAFEIDSVVFELADRPRKVAV
jgi:hypothetical protein